VLVHVLPCGKRAIETCHDGNAWDRSSIVAGAIRPLVAIVFGKISRFGFTRRDKRESSAIGAIITGGDNLPRDPPRILSFDFGWLGRGLGLATDCC
jgi:hypothetical protein